jgi:hypothetical protein
LLGALALPFGCRRQPLPRWEGDTLIYTAPGWELRIQYTSRGSRSEGQHGVLLHDGREVLPTKQGEMIETRLGWMRHYGDRHPELWRPAGWNFADHEKIQPSQRVSAQ